MTDLLQYLLNFGLGAVFAGIMFYIYRNTTRQMRSDRELMEVKLTQQNNQYNEVVRERNDVMLKFVAAITELTVWLKAKNGSR